MQNDDLNNNLNKSLEQCNLGQKEIVILSHNLRSLKAIEQNLNKLLDGKLYLILYFKEH